MRQIALYDIEHGYEFIFSDMTDIGDGWKESFWQREDGEWIHVNDNHGLTKEWVECLVSALETQGFIKI